jgi:ribosome-associated protein
LLEQKTQISQLCRAGRHLSCPDKGSMLECRTRGTETCGPGVVCLAPATYGGDSLEGSELAHLIVELLEEHQAAGIVLLDLREITPLADYFVISTAESERQSRALAGILTENLKKQHNTRPLSTEGEPASGWVLLDYNSVVVHIFSKDTRAFYRLEELWKAAPVVLKIP